MAEDANWGVAGRTGRFAAGVFRDGDCWPGVVGRRRLVTFSGLGGTGWLLLSVCGVTSVGVANEGRSRTAVRPARTAAFG
jgi:hypothetical protein